MVLTTLKPTSIEIYVEKNSTARRRKQPSQNFSFYMRSKQRLPLAYLVRN